MASKRLSVVLLTFILTSPLCANAFTVVDVPDSGGLFRFILLDPGETGEETNPEENEPSAFTLSAEEIASLKTGAEYWRGLLAPQAANTAPLTIQVKTLAHDAVAASAASPEIDTGSWAGYTGLSGALAGNWFGQTGQEYDAVLAFIKISHAAWYTGPMASLPQNDNSTGLTSVVLHELGHALGITALTEKSPNSYTFSLMPTLWSQGLRDIQGTAVQPGMVITGDASSAPAGSAFVTDGYSAYSGVYFTGDHVREVLNGAEIAFASDPDGTSTENASPPPQPVPGLPVNGWEYNGNDFIPEFSHIELQNSLMSHQDYRNWNTFMEAELAAMQDIGLKLDRRNWYGYSVYNSGSEGELRAFVNTHPYYARDAHGEWIAGEPNPTPWGTGLHVYGSDNDITQAADLLSSGAYGLGIRVDGSGNRIAIAPGVRVYADGTGGTALLAAYGRGHALILRGEARASGEGGIAARFDFGDNLLGNNMEYRGSWIRRAVNSYNESAGEWAINPLASLPDELKGALVENFAISGTLAGRAAALYIAENALVKNISVMNGAAIEGDIVSMWNPLDERIQYAQQTGGSVTELVTKLNFGRKADAEGAATGTPDPDFRLRYDGNIAGAKSIAMSVDGGQLSFNGEAALLEVLVRENATLSGNARYTLNRITDPDNTSLTVGGTFVNTGTLAPGNGDTGTIRIDGDYAQNDSGLLAADFDASGNSSRLAVSGSAKLAGSLLLTPKTGFYGNGTLSLGNIVESGNVSGHFGNAAVQDNSPTLSFSLQSGAPDGKNAVVTIGRAPGAYSRYAPDKGTASLGQALPAIASRAEGDMQPLFAAIDFSAPDGSAVGPALRQLTPGVYDTIARESLDNQHDLNMQQLPRLLESASCSPASGRDPAQNRPCNDWSVTVHPFGQYRRLDDSGHHSGYASYGGGLSVNADRTDSDGLTLGFAATLSDRHVSSHGGFSAKSRILGAYAGTHALYQPVHWNGTYILGMARIGFEDAETERRINFNGYRRNHKSDWTGFSGSTLAGLGKNWKMMQTAGDFSFGPLGWVEYAVVSRPSVTENGDGASRLHVASATEEGLSTALGLRAAYVHRPAAGSVFRWNALAAWRHQWQDESFSTRASFAGYEDDGFYSETEMTGRNSVLLQAGLSATDAKGRFARLSAGCERFTSGSTSAFASFYIGTAF